MQIIQQNNNNNKKIDVFTGQIPSEKNLIFIWR